VGATSDMNFQFTHPEWLLLLPLTWALVIWLAWKSDVQIGAWRRWTALALRLAVTLLLVLAVAGIQWKKPMEGLNVFFLIDRSDSIPSPQQEAARRLVNRFAADKKKEDKTGLLVFGTEAALETTAAEKIDLKDTKILAVVGTERTDIGGALRLGTAAFPETGQKRLVLLSDGNENMGDAMSAVLQARPLGVTVDIVPLGTERGNDVSVQKLGLPSRVKTGQTFDAKIFVQTDKPQSATVRLYRNEQPLGEQKVALTPGKNLYTFPQALEEPGFYSYTIQLEAAGDNVPQNNRAISFVNVQGDPRVLLVSIEPDQDRQLAEALRSARLQVKAVGMTGLPGTLAEMQSYDAIFISNLAAGDLGQDNMKLLESAVRDFGVGLVCVGGDQTYAAGAYRGTPLEATLPVNMELDSKKVLPKGAVALIMHGMEFANGNQVSRDCALGVLDALGPTDEMGVIMWNGSDTWVVPLSMVGDKKEHGRKIAGMNQGDMIEFGSVIRQAQDSLEKSTANLKHMLIFSDGDPGAPTPQLMQSIVENRITVSTVLIAGHAGPDTMIRIADQGRGRFYNVQNASQLPQIFIKEAAVILKSAIFEDPFTPKLVAASEIVRGIGNWPILRGYVCTTPKPRAEIPLVSDKGDPILAHWQYGLGRAVAFTSDAKSRWARDWLGWEQYRQFWSQTAQWALRRVENADFTTDVAVDRGEGFISVDAVDKNGDYRNFLTLDTVVVSPKGERVTVRLEQTGPGHYEARFPTKEVGAYNLSLREMTNGQLAGMQSIGASVNYSPEFTSPEANLNLLARLAEAGGGKLLDAAVRQDPLNNPFLHDRSRTFQPRDWWEWLLKVAVVLFVFDVAVRRIHIERDQWEKAMIRVKQAVFFWKGVPRLGEADLSLAALLARRDQVRTETAPPLEVRPELFSPQQTVVLPSRPARSGSSLPTLENQESEQSSPSGEQKPESTTSRLLDAKRRAQRRRE
jgi:Ca-activated chloride channel homolog